MQYFMHYSLSKYVVKAMRISILTSMLLFAFSALTASNSVDFYSGSFESALTEAATKNKMVFVDFYATWCAPCQWMDKTTFRDRDVITRLNEDFIALKVNIDDFEGFELKERYGIKVLPTILIFNESGELVDRREETLSPSMMNTLLTHNLSNRLPAQQKVNASPSETYVQPTVSKNNLSSDALENYQLQLAVFSDYARTLKYYNQVSPVIEQPMIVLHGFKGDQIIYKVLITNLATREEAESLRTRLKDMFNIDSFVKLS